MLVGYWSVPDGRRERAALTALRPRQLTTGPHYAIGVIAEPNVDAQAVVPVIDGASRGWLIGQAFTGDCDPIGQDGGPVELTADRSTSGGSPWGDWVAASTDGQRLTLMRSALSGRTLYSTLHRSGIAFASSAALLATLTGRRFDRDWDSIASWLTTASFGAARSAFVGVERVAAGTTVQLGVDRERCARRIWRPEEFARAATPTFDPEEIQETLLTCVRAWGGTMRQPWVSLSGGLDSSAALWAARQSFPQVRAMHTHNAARRAGNELDRARLVSAHLGVPLEIIDVQDHLGFGPVRSTPLSEPDTRLLGSPLDSRIAEVVSATGSILTGVGGDPVWCAATGYPHHLGEVLRYRGLRAWWRESSRYSRYQGFPLLPLAASTGSALATGWTGRAARRLLRDRSATTLAPSWLQQPSTEDTRDVATSLAALRGLSRGKAAHLLAIADFHALVAAQHERLAEPTELHPMFSQPLVELALRTAVPAMISAVDDRISFRASLRGAIPEAIRTNRRKGESSGTLIAHVRHSAEMLAALIVDGEAARQGLVDPELALAELRAAKLGHSEPIGPLLRLAAVEIWSANWDAVKIDGPD